MQTVHIEFTFPFLVGGQLAAEFECRASAKVRLGRPASHSPWPGEPAEGDDVEDYGDIEVLAGGEYHAPDDALRTLILAYLQDRTEDERFVEAARDDSGPDPDYQRDLRQEYDMGRVVWDPTYRENVKIALSEEAEQ
jgi:hypothetical protein